MFLLELLKTILLGIVEGITEWLPISSTGHLILLNNFIKLDVSEEFWEMFEVVIQLGAIMAVVLLLRVLASCLTMRWMTLPLRLAFLTSSAW